MNLADITKLVSLILAVSIAGERLVTLIKSVFPFLAAPPGTVQQKGDIGAIAKRVLLMAIAFGCCWLTASFLPQPITIGTVPVPIYFIGLLASGGSAFWTNLLGYLSALKDLNKQKAIAAAK